MLKPLLVGLLEILKYGHKITSYTLLPEGNLCTNVMRLNVVSFYLLDIMSKKVGDVYVNMSPIF